MPVFVEERYPVYVPSMNIGYNVSHSNFGTNYMRMGDNLNHSNLDVEHSRKL